MKMLLFVIVFCEAIAVKGQNVGIGTPSPNPSSILELQSSNQGILIPRTTLTSNISLPVTGLLVYQTNSPAGFYYFTGSQWILINSNISSWNVGGNTGTNSATDFLGTADLKNLNIRANNITSGLIDVTGTENTSFGYYRLFSNSNVRAYRDATNYTGSFIFWNSPSPAGTAG